MIKTLNENNQAVLINKVKYIKIKQIFHLLLILIILINVSTIFVSAAVVSSSQFTDPVPINDNQYQSVNDSNAYIYAYPSNVYRSQYISFEFMSKKYSGDVDFAFGFNTTEAIPKSAQLYKPHTVYWNTTHEGIFYNVSSILTSSQPCDYGNEYNALKRNVTHIIQDIEGNQTITSIVCFDSYIQDGTTYTTYWDTQYSRLENWLDITSSFQTISHTFDGKDTWYLLKNINITANETYKIKSFVEVLPNSTGKYDIAIKLSSDTVAEAIANNRFYFLDPEWKTTDLTGFDLGTYNQTMWNSSINAVTLENDTSTTYYTTGNYTSKVFDAAGVSTWNNVSWTQAHPYGQELPNYGANELANGVLGGIDMAGAEALWHLNNDSAYGDIGLIAYDYTDGLTNGTCTGTACPLVNNTDCVFGNCKSFDGVNDVLLVGDSVYMRQGRNRTYTTWVKGIGAGSQGFIFDNYVAGNIYLDGTTIYGRASDGTWRLASIPLAGFQKDKWYHLTLTLEEHNELIFYVNGLSVANDSLVGTVSDNTYSFYVGQEVGGSTYLKMTLDEFAIFNRSLSANEVMNIYRRGANNLGVQVRTCSESDCSDNPDFVGPDNTTATSFTNSTLVDLNTTITPNNQYFQYKVKFETNNENVTPELYNISIDYSLNNQPPTVTLNQPANNSNFSVNYVLLNTSVTDLEGENMTVYFLGNDSVINVTTNVVNGSEVTYNWTGLGDGSYNWSVTAGDGAINTSSDTYFFEIDNTSPTFTNLANQSILDNQTLEYDIDATDSGVGVDSFSVNDTINFQINSTGYLTNATDLIAGTYWLEISVNDTLNNTNQGTIFIEVNETDNQNPSATIGKNVSQVEYGLEAININWTSSDDNLDTIIFNVTYPNDSVLYESSSSSGDINLTSSNLTELGIYNINLWANDTFGNENSTSDSFSVNDTTAPTTNLISPGDASTLGGAEQTFTCNATELFGLANISLYNNATGVWHLNDTNDASGTFNETSFTVSGLDYTTFVWNCLATDSNGLSSFASSNFTLTTASDIINPAINSHSITSGLTSGESATIRSNVTDSSAISLVWFTINNTDGTLTNYTMSQEGSTDFYNSSFEVGEAGTWYYKIYANDSSGNLNDSIEWQSFSVSAPSAIAQNEDFPSKALPSSPIKISGDLAGTDSLKDVYAYLNVPDKFSFIETSTYPQNQSKGNFSASETKTATWLLYGPGTLGNYEFNITWSDKYGNQWQGSNEKIDVEWSGGVEQLSVSSATGSFYSPGDTVIVYASTTNSSGTLVSSTINMNITYPNSTQLSSGAAIEETTGKFKYNFTLPDSSPVGTYPIRIDANYSGDEAHDVLSFLVSSALEDIKDNVSDIIQNQESDFQVLLSDFGEVAAGQQYRVKLWVFNFNGIPKNADSIPTITLYDPLRNKIVEDVAMSLESTGIYVYNFTTSSSQTDGVWEAIATAIVNGTTVKPSDWWELESSPAEVVINDIPDKTISTISADVTITNEGSGSQEYQYEYCIVSEQDNSCGGGDDVAYASAAKLLTPGQSFNPILTLGGVTSVGNYYFKILVFFGTEKSGASELFTAISEVSPSEEPAASSGGGGSSVGEITGKVTYETGDEEIKQGKTQVLGVGEEVKFNIIQEKVVYSHSLEIISLDPDKAKMTINSQPITLLLYIGDDKNLDLEGDGYYDLYVKLEKIEDNMAYVYLKSIYQKIEVEEPEKETETTPQNKTSSLNLDRTGQFFKSFYMHIKQNNLYLVLTGLLLIGLLASIIVRRIKKKGKSIKIRYLDAKVRYLDSKIRYLKELKSKKKISESSYSTKREKLLLRINRILRRKPLVSILGPFVLIGLFLVITKQSITGGAIGVGESNLGAVSWWTIFGVFVVLFLAGIFAVLIYILKEIKKLRHGWYGNIKRLNNEPMDVCETEDKINNSVEGVIKVSNEKELNLRKKYPENSLKGLINKKVYSENGHYIGRIKDVILGENRTESLKIKIDKKHKFNKKGIIINYRHVRGIGEIIIIDEAVSEQLNNYKGSTKNTVFQR